MAELSTPDRLHAAVVHILPLPRSLTGAGVRETLERLSAHVPLRTVEVPSGTPALDWEVPQEWTLRAARLVGPDGQTVIDVDDHALHLVGYSVAVDDHLTLEALQPHLHSDPDHPDVIPYRTSYYTPRWGFCLADSVRQSLPDGTYHVHIDTRLAPGSMSYGEVVVEGRSDFEVVVTSHVCHPAMANDNASGNVVAAAVAQRLLAADRPPRHTWRFLWLPGTIGELTWLARNRDRVDRIVGGLVLAGVGDRGSLTYKRSRRARTLMDRAAIQVLGESHHHTEVVDFSPWGYAERQFCSPGFDLGVGRLSRTEHGTYPEYHTSADDASFVTGESLHDTVEAVLAIADRLERNRTFRNLKPHGEPRLGPRGLYPSMGGPAAKEAQLALLWVLSASDGTADLLDVTERSGMRFAAIADAADALAQTDLLEPLREEQ